MKIPISLLVFMPSFLLSILCGCAAKNGSDIRPLSNRSLASLLGAKAQLRALDGKRVDFSAVVYSFDRHWGIADLRAHNRALPFDQAGLSLAGDCIDLISPGQTIADSPGAAIKHVTGILTVTERISDDVVTSLKAFGVEFSPRCNYAEPYYIFLRADRLE